MIYFPDFQKTYFWPIFDPLSGFPENLLLTYFSCILQLWEENGALRGALRGSLRGRRETSERCILWPVLQYKGPLRGPLVASQRESQRPLQRPHNLSEPLSLLSQFLLPLNLSPKNYRRISGLENQEHYLRPEKAFPRICLPEFWAKFGWTFGGEFLLKPFILWIEGTTCSETSWEGFGWFFAIEWLFRSPNYAHFHRNRARTSKCACSLWLRCLNPNAESRGAVWHGICFADTMQLLTWQRCDALHLTLWRTPLRLICIPCRSSCRQAGSHRSRCL